MSLRALVLACLLLAPLPAQAQEPPPGIGPPVQILTDLAETLGQAHAVRSLCNGEGDQTWRSYMQNMLAIEAPSGPLARTLTSAFNRGFRTQSSRTRTCTSDMPQVEAQIAARGRALAEMVAASYLQ
jgi:uncharacterized protein (TIGR02301 family)